MYNKYLLQWKHGTARPQRLTVSWSEIDPAMSEATQLSASHATTFIVLFSSVHPVGMC